MEVVWSQHLAQNVPQVVTEPNPRVRCSACENPKTIFLQRVVGASPRGSAKCPGIVVLPAGTLISLTFCRPPRELIPELSMGSWKEEGKCVSGKVGVRTDTWVTIFYVYLFPRCFEMVLTQCDSRAVL